MKKKCLLLILTQLLQSAGCTVSSQRTVLLDNVPVHCATLQLKTQMGLQPGGRLTPFPPHQVEPHFYSPYFDWSFQGSKYALPLDVALHSAPNDHHGIPLLTKDWKEVCLPG